ncbi:inositol monophosphatase family protein [Phytoactinopolyspora endophytica]|uniref:inositol monophosphatase family protein n=1 Tax=Phytoactinopolyspora endophytica TaxID=1642495 RepID=UPI00101C87A2|nr:inositol monophosphatase family protein [Phytoactinopolyspora endophytica]
MQDIDVKSLVDLAVSAAHEAGALARDRRRAVERMAVAATKSTPTDVVTESDTAAEQLIRDRLLAVRPGDAIHGEEGGHSAGDSDVVWVVDPIDGTVNYLYGIPQYAVSIAAQVDATVEAGVVYNPASDETWTAVRGSGALLNGEPIAVTGCADLSLALVGTGFGYDAGRRARQAAVLAELVPVVRDIRRAGSAALDLCAVASGRLDAYYERGLNPWDRAAGGLIAAEAGAVVSGLYGQPPAEAMTFAATPGIAEDLRALLERLGADRV